MPVSVTNSQVIYDALKAVDVRLVSALPETWLVHLIRMAEDDPEMTLVRLAKEEEGVGLSAGAHFAGVKSAMLMQHRGAPGRQIPLRKCVRSHDGTRRRSIKPIMARRMRAS